MNDNIDFFRSKQSRRFRDLSTTVKEKKLEKSKKKKREEENYTIQLPSREGYSYR